MKTLIRILFTFFLVILTSNLFASNLFASSEASLSLTASDGTGLQLRKLEARVVLDGFLAFTELEMVFYNPENRRREGHFQIILPDNAAISRFAMKIGETLQEGEIVEKQQARRAYEDFLHRRQDPALLETDSGNRFNARIFPIEPQSEKLLILSYSQRLTQDYVLPLKGLPKLQQLLIRVFYDSNSFNPRQPTQLGALSATVSKRDVLTVDKRDYQPTDDFKMPYQPSQADRLALRSEQLVAAKIIPFPESSTSSPTTPSSLSTLVILLDTSASQAPFWSDTVKRLKALLPLLKVEKLEIYTFDQIVTKVGTATSSATQLPLLQKLQEYPTLGASRLDAVAAPLKDLKLNHARILLISDLVITAGETSATMLVQQFKTIPWLDRLDVLIPSYHSNKSLATKLVAAGKTTGMVASIQSLSDVQLAQKLLHRVYADLPITVTDATWSWPATVESLQANEPLIIFADLSSQAPTASPEAKPITIQVADQTFSITPQPVHPILLKREWSRARIDRLLDMEDTTPDKDLKSAYHNEVTHLSVKERVLSPYTSLLVLETEEDYRRYNIDRQALSDILTVGIDGLTVIKRAGLEVPPPPSPMIEDRPMPLAASKTRPRPSNGDSTASPASPPAPSVSENKPQSVGSESNEAMQANVGRKQEIEGEAAKDKGKEEEKNVDAKEDVDMYKKADSDEATTAQSGKANAIGLSESVPQMAPEIPPPPASWEESDRFDGASLPLEASRREETREETIMEASRMEAPDEVRSMATPELDVQTGDSEQRVESSPISAWTGHYAEFRNLLDKGDLNGAGKIVQAWRQTDLADLMALIALGEWYAKMGDTTQAARAYGSLIDYFPARADMRRWTGERLLSLKTESWLSIDTFKKAVEQRPDHPSGHYLLALAYWEGRQYKEAIETLQTALQRQFDPRFLHIQRILQETMALMLTTLEKRDMLDTLGSVKPANWDKVTQPQLRFVLMWETDANDVDFHLYDKKQNHAFYSQPALPTGGTLYADITTGYGPECFTIPNPKAFPYKVEANYYNMGPMGYGMGLVHVLRYVPNQGGIQSEFRPFVVMQNGATAELGEVK